MASQKDWNRYRNVLCVRLDNIGDVVMTTPALRALKDSCPGRTITLLTSPLGGRLAGLIPAVDRTVVYDAPWIKAAGQHPDSRSEHAMACLLKRQGFDAAVIFTVYSQSPLPAAFLCHLADIPVRLAHCRENPYQLLTHWVPDPEPKEYVRHEVERQLDLVSSVGCLPERDDLSLKVPAAAFQRVRRILQAAGVDTKRPWIVLHTGATAPSRRYPEAGFATVARTLFAETGFTVIFSGTEEERERVERIRALAGSPSFSLAGHLDIEELAALISLSSLLVSNNTGPVHIAAALGTRVVDLYALTNPQHTPWKVSSRVLYHDVPCRYCYKSVCPRGHQRCLSLVKPETVVNAAIELLGEKNAFVRFGHTFSVSSHIGSPVRHRTVRNARL